jgi:predicted ABC-type ATPase
MSVFALDSEGAASVAEEAAAAPMTDEELAPSFFEGTGTGIGMGVMRGGARVGQFIGMAAVAPVVVAERLFNEEPETSDAMFRAIDEYVNDAVDYWTPRAEDVGTAGRVLGGLSEITLPLMLGAGNPTLLAGSMQMGGATDLVREGVDAPTAVGVGAIESVSTALGFKVPFLGKTLATRMGSGAGGNLAINTATSAGAAEVLEQSGDTMQAERYSPWNLEARSVDVLTGLVFGAIAHGSSRRATQLELDAALTAENAKHFQEDTAPGIPADVNASVAHQEAIEQAIRDIIEGNPVTVPEKVLEADFVARPKVEQPTPEDYRDLDAPNFGLPDPPRTVLDDDPILIPTEKIATPERFALREQLVIDSVRDAVPVTGRKPIAFLMAGGGASGKGTLLSLLKENGDVPSTGAVEIDPDAIKGLLPEYGELLKRGDSRAAAVVHEESSTLAIQMMDAALSKRADLIVDRTLSNPEKAAREIQKLRNAGYEVRLFGVTVDPANALQRAVTRAKRSGRYVPLDALLAAHKGFANGFERLAELVDEAVLYDNDVAKGAQPAVIAQRPAGEALQIRDETGYNRFVERRALNEQARTYRDLTGRIAAPTVHAKAHGRSDPLDSERDAGADAPRDEGSGRQDQAAAPSHLPGQRVAGEPQSIFTATGRAIQVQPVIVELDSLLTSDRAGYPQELQPRQRGARAASTEQIRDIANNLQPELLGFAPEADRGAPIIGPDAAVESGNGRVMALRAVYETIPAKAAAYKTFLESIGLDLKGFKQPVLVRVRQTPLEAAERRAFTVEANQSSTMSLSAVERAQADAQLLDGEVMASLKPGELASAGNVGFSRAFLAKLPVSERNALVGPDGILSQEGLRRIQAAVLAKAYGGTPESNRTLGRMLESMDNDMRSVSGALLDAAGEYAQLRQAITDLTVSETFDIAPKIVKAVESIATIRANDASVHDWLLQVDMLNPRDPVVDGIVRAFYSKDLTRLAGREKIAATLERYARDAKKQRLDQGSLFGGKPPSPTELLRGIEDPDTAVMKPPADMFGLRTPQGKKPASAPAATQPVATIAIDAAKARLEASDIRITTGEFAPDGTTQTLSAREVMTTLEANAARAAGEAKAFDAAVGCFLSGNEGA